MLALGMGLAILRQSPQWWPPGATFAADFAARRYMRDGVEITEAAAFSVARSGAAWSTNAAGTLIAHAVDEPRFVAGGLLLEPARTRISLAPVAVPGSYWSSTSSVVTETLAAEGLFTSPARLSSGGFDYSRRVSTAMDLAAGVPVHLKVRYRAGTSPNFGAYMRSTAANLQSVLSGPVGTITALTTTGGNWSSIANAAIGSIYELEAAFTPITSQNDWQLGMSPRSSTVGESVEVLSAQVVLGSETCSWILGDPSTAVTRPAESLALTGLTYPSSAYITYVDASSQTVPVSASTLVIPASSLERKVVQAVVCLP